MRACAVLMVAALAAGACAGDDAELPPGGGQMVVTGADGSVALVDPADGLREVLTEGAPAGAVVQPTASPDGTTVVWTEVSPAGARVMVHTEGETRRVAAPAAPFFYLFAPGGNRLAALGNDPDGGGVALMMVDLVRESAEIIDTGQPYYLDWHPDGGGLVAHIGTDVLATIALDGSRHALGAAPGLFQAPQVMADGRVLVVTASGGLTASVTNGVTAQLEGGTLAFIHPDGELVEPVATASSLVSFEAAPDGDRVAFIDGVGRGGTALGPLRVATTDGSEPVVVAEETVVAFEWSPDGQHLLFLTLDREEGLIPGVWDGSAVVEHPGFLPSRVFLAQYLPFWDQYARSVTQWSPDGTEFAFAAAGEDGGGVIWVQPLNGARRDMGEGEMVTWAP